jgi:hypothetical protein
MMTRFIVRKSMNALKKVQKKMKIKNNYIFFSPGHKPCEPLTTLSHKLCEPLTTLSRYRTLGKEDLLKNLVS